MIKYLNTVTMIRENVIFAAVAGGGPSPSSFLLWEVMGHLSWVHLSESFPCWICVLHLLTHRTTSNAFKTLKTKRVLCVCLLVLPCAILLPGGKFKTHKRRRLINYQRWTAKLLKAWHSRMENKFIRQQYSEDYENSESIFLPQEPPSTQSGG